VVTDPLASLIPLTLHPRLPWRRCRTGAG